MEILGSGWLWSLVLLSAAALLIWFAAGFWVWLLVGATLLTAMSATGEFGLAANIVGWFVFVAGIALLGLPPLRVRLFSRRMMRMMRQEMPPISATERIALDAGQTGWEAELFSGRPSWRRLRRLPVPRLSEAERAFLDGPVEAFCALISDYRINEVDHDLPPEAWNLLKAERFFGMTVPPEFGGLGFSASAQAAVIMKIASRSLSAALTAMIPNSVGPAKLIVKYGTQSQKERYLPGLASGEEIPCFALTGPEAGSDASSISDSGVVCRQDHAGVPDVLGVRLNFEKRYITLAPVASLLGVAFKLYDPEHLLGEQERRGITLALIPANAPGVEGGRRHDPLHMGFHNGPVSGRDVFVPLDAIVGETEGVGQGWRMLMECLTDGRAISLPALSCGAAKLATRVTGAYARIRFQFHTPISTFEGVHEALAPMAGQTWAMECARQLILAELDDGTQPAVAAGIVKYNLTERCRRVIEHGMDVHAGAAICLGPRNLIAEFAKFGPIGTTVEGANILTRTLMTFGQGVIRCHPCLQTELTAATRAGAADMKGFDRAAARHLRLAARNGLRSLVHGLTGARFAGHPARSRARRRDYRQVARISAGFALATDILLVTLRGQFKRRERLLGRMADVLSNMYIATAALRHHEHADGDASDNLLLDWVMADSLFRCQTALEAVCANLPRIPGGFLKWMLFPLGRPWGPPEDRLEDRLVELITVPSTGRDRIAAGIHIPSDPDEPLAKLEAALGKVTMTSPLASKLREGTRRELVPEGPFEQRLEMAVVARVLTRAEADELRYAEKARREALEVDAFGPQHFESGDNPAGAD